MSDITWIDLGDAEELASKPVQRIVAGDLKLALTYADGKFCAISSACNHVGGPLGEGTLDGEYVVCPWHYWSFHRETGVKRSDECHAVPSYDVRIENGRVLVAAMARSERRRPKQQPHPLARPVERQAGPIRVLGISTTVMTAGHTRYSTSEALLETALDHAREAHGCETRLQRVRDLAFRACEGFYSKAARACTWPCSITKMDPDDQMDQIYEQVVHWADVIMVATPIRWGSASSLYFKMIERMNCIQNQETIANKHLLHNKVTSFIITGGQDNVQGVAGQMLGFFAELGCQFPQFPYIAHSRGWSAEDMENNIRYVRESEALHEGAQALAGRSVDMAALLLASEGHVLPMARGGRKAHELDTHAQLQVKAESP
ncbi:MAG: Rieske 2Fe-2S domain-containing protein [Candidatus Sericytochromatia bacterium]